MVQSKDCYLPHMWFCAQLVCSSVLEVLYLMVHFTFLYLPPPQKKHNIFASTCVFFFLTFILRQRLIGSCKNSSVLYIPHSLSPMVTSYVAVIQYENQEVEIDTLLLTRLQTIYRSHHFLKICISVYVYSSVQFQPMYSFV